MHILSPDTLIIKRITPVLPRLYYYTAYTFTNHHEYKKEQESRIKLMYYYYYCHYHDAINE